MRNELIRDFIRMARRDEPLFADAQLLLIPREYYGYSKRIRCEHTFVFDVAAQEPRQTAGEIAVRIGDSVELFYLGHIGYHIDAPFRGHGYAARACMLSVTARSTARWASITALAAENHCSAVAFNALPTGIASTSLRMPATVLAAGSVPRESRSSRTNGSAARRAAVPSIS